MDSILHRETKTWWRHQMETFSALLALCAGNSPVTGEFPTQRRSFVVVFDLRVSKQLSKQSSGWWFETPSRPLWNEMKRQQLLPEWYLFRLLEGSDIISNSYTYFFLLNTLRSRPGPVIHTISLWLAKIRQTMKFWMFRNDMKNMN